MSGSGSEFVTLRGGLVLPVEAMSLALSIEGRGGTLSVNGDDLIIDGPAGLLTEADRVAIRRWRRHLKVIATYQAPEGLA